MQQCDSTLNGYLIIGKEPALGNVTVIISFFYPARQIIAPATSAAVHSYTQHVNYVY